MGSEIGTKNINMRLARDLNLSDDDIRSIDKIQEHLKHLLSAPHVLIESPDKVPSHITNIEYRLQGLFRFDQDPIFHKYGHRVKWCTCPKSDNDCMVGFTDERWKDGNCPYHGINPATSWEDERFQIEDVK